MNHNIPRDFVPIRSIYFATFEKPTATPHWSFDETLRTRARRPALTLSDALAALRALAAPPQ